MTPALITFSLLMGAAIAGLIYLNNEPKGPRHP